MATKDDSLMTETPAFFSRLLFPLTAPPEPGRRRRKPRADVLHRHRFGRAEKHFYRSIWISDVHLGTRGCQTDMLLDFLRHTESDHLYLVGDIIDCWRLRRSWFWDDAHDLVVRAIVEKARNGTKVVYIPGNHDEALRPYTASVFADIRVEREALHVTEMGETLLILHGDEFDGVMKYARWLAVLGDHAYGAALKLNTGYNKLRRLFGLPYWSLSAYLKFRVKNAVQFISRFEEAVAAEGQRRRVSGVVCGHIHHAEIRRIGSLTYYNDGDWVESCTALVEEPGGAMHLLRWADEIHKRVQRRQDMAPEAVAAE
jgi:UDP-2,3-diacylglucosamine pyrophosphatase LpxH